jgi:hypothetical protein
VSLRLKVLLAQAPLAVALLLIALVAVRTTNALGAGASAILDENYRSVLAAQRMRDAIEDLDRAALFHLAGLQPLDPAEIARHVQRFEQELAVEENNLTEEGEAGAAGELRQRWEAYRDRIATLPGLPADPTAALYRGELSPGFLAARAAAALAAPVTLQPNPSRHTATVVRMFFSSSMTSTRSGGRGESAVGVTAVRCSTKAGRR